MDTFNYSDGHCEVWSDAVPHAGCLLEFGTGEMEAWDSAILEQLGERLEKKHTTRFVFATTFSNDTIAGIGLRKQGFQDLAVGRNPGSGNRLILWARNTPNMGKMAKPRSWSERFHFCCTGAVLASEYKNFITRLVPCPECYEDFSASPFTIQLLWGRRSRVATDALEAAGWERALRNQGVDFWIRGTKPKKSAMGVKA